MGDLTPIRDFSHVLDIVDAYLLLLSQGEPGQSYNICSGTGLSVRQLLDALQTMAGTRAEIRVDPARPRPAEIPVARKRKGILHAFRPSDGRRCRSVEEGARGGAGGGARVKRRLRLAK